jgi:hypothetical protein
VLANLYFDNEMLQIDLADYPETGKSLHGRINNATVVLPVLTKVFNLSPSSWCVYTAGLVYTIEFIDNLTNQAV